MLGRVDVRIGDCGDCKLSNGRNSFRSFKRTKLAVVVNELSFRTHLCCVLHWLRMNLTPHLSQGPALSLSSTLVFVERGPIVVTHKKAIILKKNSSETHKEEEELRKEGGREGGVEACKLKGCLR